MTEPVQATPRTVGELRGLLASFDDDAPIQVTSHDGPDYGALLIGGEWSDGYLQAAVEVRNPD